MFNLIRTIALVVIAMLATIFLIQNLATIEVAFLTWSISAPRAVIFLMVFAVGLAAGYLLHALQPRRQGALRQTKGDVVAEQDSAPAPGTSDDR